MNKLEAKVKIADLLSEVSDAAERKGYYQAKLKRFRYNTANWQATASEHDKAGVELINAREALKEFVEELLKKT